ncbi:MAG: ParB N-terminal domain-containing protein, partial [Desulfofundulus sp.]
MGESDKIRKVKIDDIKIVDRVRKDMGDLEELAESIKELGLLQPVIVTPELVLVAGERRVNACRMLGWEEIPVVEIAFEDYYAQLKAERDENIVRKSFTFSETAELIRKLETVERERAKARSLANLKQNHGCQDMITECHNCATR